MEKRVLNITNGIYFNEYICKTINGIFIPFNDAFLLGKPIYPLFSYEFIKERTLTHYKDINKTKEYIGHMNFFISKTDEIKKLDKVILWFGKDTFCLINMLGVLTYLEQINYNKEVQWNIIDDETFKLIDEGISIKLGSFKDSYLSLFDNLSFKSTNNLYLDKGIKDYLYLKDFNNDIYQYIRDNINNEDLLIDLLNRTKEYGLSDTILIEMIEKVSEEKK